MSKFNHSMVQDPQGGLTQIDKCKKLLPLAYKRKPNALELHFYQLVKPPSQKRRRLVGVYSPPNRKISLSFTNVLMSCF